MPTCIPELSNEPPSLPAGAANEPISCWDASMPSNHLADQEVVLKAVSAALRDVVTKDQVLLTLHAHELALVHRFGVYLETHLDPVLRLAELTVDLDYDRHGSLPKFLPPRPDRGKDRRFRPDLIVHRRREDEHNLLVVEWKKNASDLTLECLEARIRALLARGDEQSSYGYQLGVVVNSGNEGVRWRAYDSSGPADWQCVRSV